MKSSKNSFKGLRVEYKIALISIAILVIVSALTFIFAILPIYDEAGKVSTDLRGDVEALKSAERFANVSKWVTYIFCACALFFSSIGGYKDLKEKRRKIDKSGKSHDKQSKAIEANKSKK